jgi:hypothetical protein
MCLTFVARRRDWRVLVAALARRGEGRVAQVLQAGLAFSAPGHDPAASVALTVPAAVAGAVQAAARDLDVELTLVDERAAAVAAAEAIVRAHRRGAP